MKVRGWLMLLALTFAIVLAGCSRADPSIIAAAPDTTGGGDTNTANSGPTTLDVAADLTQLKFQQETLNAAPGQPITVNFNNPSALPHTWVLVEPGQENAVNDAAAAKNGDPTGIDGVIAGTEVVNGNGTTTLNVAPLQPGTYSYICTVPGHLPAGMKGTLNVGGDTAGGDTQNPAGTATAGGDNQNAGGTAGGGSLSAQADPVALKYQEEALTGKAGQAFQVAFQNPSALEHNWVLVEPGQENAVATATAAKNGDPTGVTGVIAGSKPVANGNTTIDVPAQEAGAYPYICTVPGHYAAGMKGTLTLQP